MAKRTLIYLIEDDVWLGRLLTTGLTAQGFQVQLVTALPKSLLGLKKNLPGVVVLDLNFPRQPTKNFITTLKTDVTLNTLPIVALTTTGQEHYVRDVLDLGVRDSIVKNQSSLDQIVERLAHVLARS